MAKIAELVINLKANTASLAKDFQKATGLSRSAAESITKAFKVVTVAGASIAAGAAAILKSNIDAADGFAKLSRASGFSVESLSQLAHAMELSGIETEQWERAAKKLNGSVDDMTRGVKTAKDAFDTLGVSQREIRTFGGDNAKLLLRLADGFEKAENRGAALAALGQIFGERVGPQMANAFAQGSKGLKEMMSEADRLNLTISTETALAAEAFNDNVTRMKATAAGFGLKLSQEVIPDLNRFVILLLATSQKIPGGAQVLKDWITGFGILQAKFNPILVAIPSLGKKLEKLAADWSLNDERTDELTQTMLEFQAQMDAAFASMSRAGKSAGDHGDQQGKAKTKVDEHARAVQSLIADLVNEAATFGLSREAIALRTLELHGATREQAAFARSVLSTIGQLESTKRITDLVAEANREFDEAQGKAWRDMAANVDFAIAEAEGFHKKVKEVSTTTKESARLAEDFALTVGRGFEDAILHGRGLRDVLAGIATDFASLILQALVFQPFAKFLGGLSLFSGLFGGGIPGKQHGGPVSAGKPVLVGEAGPEIFMPPAAGMILPNKALAGDTFNLYIDARGADPRADVAIRRGIIEAMKATRRSAIAGVHEQAWRAG